MITRSQDPSPDGRRVALLVGVDRYGSGVPPLRNAVRDIEAVGQVLRDKHGYEVDLVRDEQATRASLRERLAEIKRSLREKDRLILYFAGHGLAEELRDDVAGPQGFILLQDADARDPKTFLAMTELQALLSGMACRHMLLLLDCCFAGAFRWSQHRNLQVRHATLYKERYERYLRDPAWQVITSAASDERAADWLAGKILGSHTPDTDNSPFARALCAALGGDIENVDLRVGNQRGDGVVLASELHFYIETTFARREKQQGAALQKPQIWSIGGRDKGQFLFDVPGRKPCLPSALELHEKNNPYRGLQLYREQDASLFFGRTAATEALCKKVKERGLLLVSGASGTGKSSLVRAGLLPLLRQQKDEVWRVLASKRPGTDAQSMFREWAEELERGSGALPLAIEKWQKAHPDERLFLFVDQLEELITLGSELAPFQSALAEVLRAGGASVRVVMTLRSDFEPHFGEMIKGLQAVRFPVPPLSRQELRDIIEGPASDRVLYFDPPPLVDKLLDEVVDAPAPLPLLSFVLSEMYRAALRRPMDRTLSEADYQQLGGVSGALSQRADALYDGCSDETERASFRYLILRMVVPGELARRRVLESELVFADPAEQRRIDALKKKLLEERLLVSDTDGQKQPFIEPAHDKLVMGWARLHRFITEDSAYTLQHSVLLAQRGYEAGGQLWTFDARRAQAAQALRKMPQRWNRAEAEFIRKSQRLFYGTWGAGGALVLVLMAAMALWLVRERRTSAELWQRLLAVHIERGQARLFQPGRESEGLLWLHRAQAGGSTDPMLPHLLKGAMRTVDATRAVLVAHTAAIHSAAFSRDGRRIVTASADRSIGLWDAETGRLINRVTEAHARAIYHAEFSPDGRRIVTASEDGTARIRDAESGSPLRWFREHEGNQAVHHAEFSPDGGRIVTACQDGKARVFDVDSDKLVAELAGHRGGIRRALFSPDGARILTASEDGTARIFSSAGGPALAVLEGHTGPILHVAMSRDGSRIVTVSEDGSARIFRDTGGQALAVLREAYARHAAISPDGRRIVTAGTDRVRVWAADSGQLLLTVGEVRPERKPKRFGEPPDPELPRTNVRTALFSPDGQRIITASEDGAARIWDAETGWLLAELRGHSGPLSGAWVRPDGQHILTASEDGTARVWDAGTRSFLGQPLPHSEPVVGVTYSREGRLATVSGRGQVQLWDARGHLVAALESAAPTWRPSFSSDGRRLVTASDKPVVQLWDSNNGQLVTEVPVAPYNAAAAALSPDGRRLVVVILGSKARIWDAASAKPGALLDGHREVITSALFSPDGRRVLTASLDQTVRLFDAETGQQLGAPIGHSSVVRAAAFSPDGRRVLTACDDHSARVFDIESRKLMLELKGHENGVTSAVFSPDGSRIVTTCEEDAVRIWAASDGRLLTELRGHGGPVASAALSPDGLRLASASRDGLVRVWDVSPETRSAETIGRLLRCYVPYRFEHEGSSVVIPASPSPAECQTQARR